MTGVHAPQQVRAEVVVWGGGTGGVAAALQSARMGAETLLLTPAGWLGGMVSAAGVCCPDGNELSPWQTGLWGAFLRELQRSEPEGLDQNWVSCFGYRPATAEAILRRWVAAESHLQWWPAVRLEAIARRGNRIQSVLITRGDERIELALDQLIDGSDRGDTFPLADVPHRFGWEARERWGEPSAPPAEALKRSAFFSEQPVQSPTWVVMGQLAPGRMPTPPNTELPEPFNGACAAFGLERTITYGRLPGGMVMLNWPLRGNDWHHNLADLFAPEPQRRALLYRQMQDHSLAFAAALEAQSGGWLRPSGCFPAYGHEGSALGGAQPLALMPYWREGRRLLGRDLVVEQQLLPQTDGAATAPLACDAQNRFVGIAVGNYANDHHYPGEDWPLAPKSCRWGGRWSGTPFTIPYAALISAELDNLLAADKCFSVSHMANGATRLQPLILNIGQAAGAAAALCVSQRCDPADLDVLTLQQALIHDRRAPAGPVPLWDTPWHHPRWRERQLACLADPGLLGVDGRCGGGAELEGYPPAEAHEQLWSGELRPDGTGGYVLAADDGAGLWPVITLEPRVHTWLEQQLRPSRVQLIGCLNPWGPWLRVTRWEGVL